MIKNISAGKLALYFLAGLALLVFPLLMPYHALAINILLFGLFAVGFNLLALLWWMHRENIRRLLAGQDDRAAHVVPGLEPAALVELPVGRHVRLGRHPEDLPPSVEAWTRSVSTGESSRNSARALRKIRLGLEPPVAMARSRDCRAP